jgi:hypothetical protein
VLANAVQLYKKGVDKRNVRDTEEEIASFIDNQIELKEAEILAIEKSASKFAAQNEHEFKDSLVVFDEGRITKVQGRTAYAQDYVLSALRTIKKNSKFVADEAAKVADLKEQIAQLSELRGVLETIVVEVEEEVTN